MARDHLLLPGRPPAAGSSATRRIPRGDRPFVVWHCKPSQQLAGELRKRIVARAHHHDAIARTGQPDQQVATGGAVRKSKGLAATPLDFAHDRVAADAAVDRAAEVNGLGHDQNVLGVQPACKAVHQGVPHQANRSVAMGLEHQQQAAGKRVHGVERGRYLVGVVGKVIDHGDVIGFAHDLQSATDAAELAADGPRPLRAARRTPSRHSWRRAHWPRCAAQELSGPPRRPHRYRAP